MNHRTAVLPVTAACGILALALPAVRAEEFVLAEKGQAKIAIFAPGENEWAGRRLADRLLKCADNPEPILGIKERIAR